MTRDEVINIVLTRCGRRQNSADFISHAQAEILQVQKDLELGVEIPILGGTFLPWFLLTEMMDVNTTVNEPRVAVPTGMLSMHEDIPLYLYDSSKTQPYTKLKGDTYESIIGDPRYQGSGKPKVYALVGQYFRLQPVPDAVYGLRTLVYLADTELNSDITNNWLTYAAPLVVAKLGEVIAGQYLYNLQLKAEFTTEAQRAAQKLFTMHEGREQAILEPVMGGEW